MRFSLIKTPTMDVPVMLTTADGVPINRVLTRLTRGLYSMKAPYIDSRDFQFTIDMVNPFELNRRMYLASQIFNHLSVGNEVYDCWWGLDKDKVRHGLWVHMFFRSVAFAVRH